MPLSLHSRRAVCLVAVLLALAAVPAMAQTSFGRISGTITDPTDAAVVGAKVIIRAVGTAAERTTVTDDNGYYIVTNLPVADYLVEASFQGFKSQQRTGLHIVADGKLSVDFKLEMGDMQQTVEVVAASTEVLNTVSGEISRTIDSKQVDNLSMNGRNYIQLMTLVPGAVVTNPDQFSVTTSLGAGNQTINGNRSDSNNLTVDGAFNLVAGSNGSLMNNVSPDFVQEVKLQTSNFSAEWGRMSGPAFNIVTKAGSNEFHGGLVEFFRNDKLDARNFFAAQKTQLRFNNFGYHVGGPVLKNKLFFFFGQEWKRLRQQQNATRNTVPTSRMLAGDFSGQAQLFFPGTKNPIPNNNIASLMTTDGKAIAAVYSLMIKQAASFNDAPVANNLTLAPSNPLNFREELLRLDYRLNDKHSFYGRWIQDENVLIDPFGTFSGANLPTTPTERKRPGESYLLAETWIPSASVVNEVRVNGSYASQHIPPYGNTWQRSTYGFQFPQLYSGGWFPDGIPQVSITGYANFVGPFFALMSPSTDIQFTDTLSIIRGAHTLKAGVIVIRDRVDQNGRPSYLGNASFNASGNSNTTGNAVADALLGNFRTYSEASADPIGFFRFWQPEAFVQDSWKVNRKLSLELGVRYQYMQPLYTQANNMSNFVPAQFDRARAVKLNTNGTIVAGSGNRYNGLVRVGEIPSAEMGRVPGSSDPFVQTIPVNGPRGLYESAGLFAPRFGFAFALNAKTTFRGGFGIFFNRPEGNITFSQVNLPPFMLTTQFDNGNLANPAGGVPSTQSLNGSIGAIDPAMKNAYTSQMSLSIQRELPRGLFLETSYVGTLGRHLTRQPNINYTDLAQVAANPSYNTNYFAPFPGYTSIQQYKSDATSNYHALQVFVSKRAGSITFTSGYTWSKVLTSGSGLSDNSENYQNLKFSYGPASYDRRHTLSTTFVWELPKLMSQPAALRYAAGGWQLSGVVRLQSGPYVTITGNSVTGGRRADYMGGPVLAQSGRDINNWINKAAFAAAPTGRWGTSGVGIVEAPGLQSYDMSLAKNFNVHERINLRFQSDFFNAFNIANFTGLGTNVSTSSFGMLATAYPPRQIQLALKLQF